MYVWCLLVRDRYVQCGLDFESTDPAVAFASRSRDEQIELDLERIASARKSSHHSFLSSLSALECGACATMNDTLEESTAMLILRMVGDDLVMTMLCLETTDSGQF